MSEEFEGGILHFYMAYTRDGRQNQGRSQVFIKDLFVPTPQAASDETGR